MSEETVEKGLDYIRGHAKAHAEAKAKRVYLEQFRKSKKAMLMKLAEREGAKSGIQQEREAYAHPEYLQLLDALEEATKQEEEAKWYMKLAEFEFEKWRTKEATARKERERYGA